MGETAEARVKRLYMRSIRRGIKEMDVIFTSFADAHLRGLSEAELDQYEAVLAEADQDLLQWVTRQTPVPEEHSEMLHKVMAHFSE